MPNVKSLMIFQSQLFLLSLVVDIRTFGLDFKALPLRK